MIKCSSETPRQIGDILEDILEELRIANGTHRAAKAYTATQVAAMLGVSRQTVNKWMKKGLLTRSRVGTNFGFTDEDIRGIKGRKQ